MAPSHVGALIMERLQEPHILLGRRSVSRAFFPNVRDVPDGYCEPGQSPAQALFRELREEVGIVPTAWRPFNNLVGPIPAVS